MLDGRFDSRADSLLSLAQLAEVLATVDPVTWAEEARSKRNLIQVGIADTSVPLLAARLHARALDATWLAPGDVPVWGLAPSKAPATAYVEVDFGDENPAPTATPPTVETPVHEATRRVPAVIEQVGLFLKTGELKHTCDGPCDPD